MKRRYLWRWVLAWRIVRYGRTGCSCKTYLPDPWKVRGDNW